MVSTPAPEMPQEPAPITLGGTYSIQVRNSLQKVASSLQLTHKFKVDDLRRLQDLHSTTWNRWKDRRTSSRDPIHSRQTPQPLPFKCTAPHTSDCRRRGRPQAGGQ